MPVSVKVAGGMPSVVIVNVPATPTWNVAVSALVNTGACLTFSVKVWVASGSVPVGGGKVKLVLVWRAGGRRTRDGRGAVAVVGERELSGSASVGRQRSVGERSAVTVNVPAVPTTKIADGSLVIAGVCAKSMVSVWAAAGLVWLVAVIVT